MAKKKTVEGKPLAFGMGGKQVALLHSLINTIGIEIDEAELKEQRFGSTTREAVRRMQLLAGAAPTGTVDRKTQKLLSAAVERVQASLPPNDASRQANPDEYSIEGDVTDMDGLPLQGATVIADALNLKKTRTMSSEVLHEQTVYGEGQAADIALNLRTRVFQHFDTAGVVTSMGHNPATGQDEAYDFKGYLLRSSRTVADKYKKLYNWAVDTVQQSWDTYSSNIQYDALNRPVELIAPYSATRGGKRNTIHPIYNEANLLNAVKVNLREETGSNGKAQWTSFVANIDYNAKGQRTLIQYGNNVITEYEYDLLTYRLTRLTTTRGNQDPLASECSPEIDPRTCKDPPDNCLQLGLKKCRLQNLNYTYDPEGNITHIRDNAQQTIFFRNLRVEPSSDYTYDATYRLINAAGREHLGQTGDTLNPPKQPGDMDVPRMSLPHPGDGKAMGNYSEAYEYDAVGNILKMIHQAVSGSWTRRYEYNEDSLLEPITKKSNRLTSTSLPGDDEVAPYSCKYSFDTHGNMTKMPHLALMQWDFKDQLLATSKQVIKTGDTPEITYYVYDASGQRLRKVTERQNETRKNERLYLGGYEVYREYGGDGIEMDLERETLHLMDDKQRIALVETKTIDKDKPASVPTNLTRYQFGNHLGSASLELDEIGQIISYEEFFPYGSTSYQAVDSQREVSAKRYRYTGKERDEENGLYYHGARYYAPWLGRWVSCDPAGLVGGINQYLFVRNNPLFYTDPNGRQPGADALIMHPEYAEGVHKAQAAFFSNVVSAAGGALTGAANIFIEAGKQVHDIWAGIWNTGHPNSEIPMISSIAEMSEHGEGVSGVAKQMWKNIVQTPQRLMDAAERDDSYALGGELFNLYMLGRSGIGLGKGMLGLTFNLSITSLKIAGVNVAPIRNFQLRYSPTFSEVRAEANRLGGSFRYAPGLKFSFFGDTLGAETEIVNKVISVGEAAFTPTMSTLWPELGGSWASQFRMRVGFLLRGNLTLRTLEHEIFHLKQIQNPSVRLNVNNFNKLPYRLNPLEFTQQIRPFGLTGAWNHEMSIPAGAVSNGFGSSLVLNNLGDEKQEEVHY